MKQSIIFMLLTLIISVSEAQTYYTLDICRQAYENRMYETILPSLLNIKKTAENDGKFDAWEYFNASDLLCKIYTDYYNNPEYSVKIMEDVYQTLAMKTDSSHTSPIHFAAFRLSELYRLIYRYDMSEKYLEKAGKMFNFFCNCEFAVYLPKEKLNLYCATKNKVRMLSEIQNVLKIYKEFVGDIMTSTDYLAFDVLDKVASAYYELGDTVKSEKNWEHILEHIKPTDSKFNSLFNSVINSLALIKMNRHQWQDALALYDRIKMFNDYYNIDYYKNILTCALFTKNIEKIKKYYILFSKEMVANKSRILFKSIEEKHYKTWSEAVKNVEYYNFAAIRSQMPIAIGDAFATTVFFKNISMQSNILLKKLIMNSGQINLIAAYTKCQDLKHKLFFSKSNPDEKSRLFSEYETIFDSILTQSQRLTQTMWNQLKSFGEIQRQLSENDCVIEFCLVPDYDNYPNHTDYFGAYIIGKNYSVPKLIKLAEVSTVENLLNSSSDNQLFYSELYSLEKSRQLYDLIFKPLESNLKNARTIYYSPYGVLSNINFNFLADDNGRFLCNKTNLVRISSLAQIMQVKSCNPTVAKSAAIFGNIDYKTPQNTSADATKRNIDFLNLPYTKIEIDSIVKVLNAHNIAVQTYEKTAATEESFKGLSGLSPEILHLATHGFCFDTKEKAANKPFAQSVNTYSKKESAMALSGLALSGANNAWKGNFDLPNVEDGILTAYEISQLDLSNTKLVVLSACETARGRIFPLDGVFGLQRAFKQAGAGSILMSLWKIDDNATATFMEYFYKFLFETNDRHKALKMAQDEVRKQYPDPYYWAAWVMLD